MKIVSPAHSNAAEEPVKIPVLSGEEGEVAPRQELDSVYREPPIKVDTAIGKFRARWSICNN